MAEQTLGCPLSDRLSRLHPRQDPRYNGAVRAVQSWRRNWARLIPFFDYPPEIRKVIYTTNAIESVNMSLRKITKNRGAFPALISQRIKHYNPIRLIQHLKLLKRTRKNSRCAFNMSMNYSL